RARSPKRRLPAAASARLRSHRRPAGSVVPLCSPASQSFLEMRGALRLCRNIACPGRMGARISPTRRLFVMSTELSNSRKSPPRPTALAGPQRLQKLLAVGGFGSRRHCEELIVAGRVEVDRQVVTELGAKADPRSQEIRVDGVPLARPRMVYFV